MGRLFRDMSIAGQLFAGVGACLVVTATMVVGAARTAEGEAGVRLRLELIAMLCLGAVVMFGVLLWLIRRLLVDPIHALEVDLAALAQNCPPAQPHLQPPPPRELQRLRVALDQ